MTIALTEAPHLRSSHAPGPEPLYREEWDYTEHARYYYARPNYTPAAIDELVEYVGFADTGRAAVADIGAGTGNLTLLLLERGFRPVAIEPNPAMMEIGMRRTVGQPAAWRRGMGERTGLAGGSFDWMTFGSSFGTCDRQATLDEVGRVLKPGGWFTCMWNHRDLVNDPVQAQVEAIIRRRFPDYAHGVRRQDQRPILEQSGLFGEIHLIEHSFVARMSMEQYQDGWRSVKNRYWDLKTPEGRATLEAILQDVAETFGDITLEIPYTTRIWTARLAK